MSREEYRDRRPLNKLSSPLTAPDICLRRWPDSRKWGNTYVFGGAQVEQEVVWRGGLHVEDDGVVPALPNVGPVTPETVAARRHRHFDLRMRNADTRSGTLFE